MSRIIRSTLILALAVSAALAADPIPRTASGKPDRTDSTKASTITAQAAPSCVAIVAAHCHGCLTSR